MAIAEALLPEFDHEMGVTRRLLERVPEDKFAWRPHAKSYSMIELATHVATIPFWGVPTLTETDRPGAPNMAWSAAVPTRR